jgi:hypothetical protein
MMPGGLDDFIPYLAFFSLHSLFTLRASASSDLDLTGVTFQSRCQQIVKANVNGIFLG